MIYLVKNVAGCGSSITAPSSFVCARVVVVVFLIFQHRSVIFWTPIRRSRRRLRVGRLVLGLHVLIPQNRVDFGLLARPPCVRTGIFDKGTYCVPRSRIFLGAELKDNGLACNPTGHDIRMKILAKHTRWARCACEHPVVGKMPNFPEVASRLFLHGHVVMGQTTILARCDNIEAPGRSPRPPLASLPQAMASNRLLCTLLALLSFTPTLAVPGRTPWPPAAALNGVLPPLLKIPDGDDVIRQFGLSQTQLYQQQVVQILNIPGYANWTETGWNVRLHGTAYRDPPLGTAQLNDAAKPFVPGLDYDTMNDTMKIQARNLTSGIAAVPAEEGVYLSFDFVYNRHSIATVSYPGPTDDQGEYDAFVQVAVARGTVPDGNVTINPQGVELFNNVSISGNASTYFVPTQGITLITDIDDILRETKIWNPDEGLRNSFAYPFRPWMNMPDILNRWDAAIPNLHFHYLTTIPIKLARPYMSFIYGRYPLGSFDVRPLNAKTLDQTFSIRKLNLHRVFETFPYRKFVLLADTSNQDVMRQYPAIVKEFPGRVQCILLRNASATDPSDYFPYDTSGFRDLDNSTYMFFRTPDDIAGLNFTNGDCRNASVPQNATFEWQAVSNLLNRAPARSSPLGLVIFGLCLSFYYSFERASA